MASNVPPKRPREEKSFFVSSKAKRMPDGEDRLIAKELESAVSLYFNFCVFVTVVELSSSDSSSEEEEVEVKQKPKPLAVCQVASAANEITTDCILS